jgi:dephospho-CoA kinase
MLKVGITGGIGSGKSTACRIFSILGVPVYHSDLRASALMQSDPELRGSIIKNFGENTYRDQNLDRKLLASLVFPNSRALALLNSLVHPVVLKDSEAWMKIQVTPYVIKEAALLFESGANHQLDRIIGVSAPQALRIRRVMERDGKPRQEIMLRIRSQIPEKIKMLLCEDLLYNDEKRLLVPQVMDLHRELLRIAGGPPADFSRKSCTST